MKAIILILWFVAVAVLSLMPADMSTARFFEHEDKLAHVLMYLIMSFLILRATKRDVKHQMILAFSVSAVYGALMEVFQDIVGGGRHFDYFDIIANIIGALIGCLMFDFMSRRKQLGEDF